MSCLCSSTAPLRGGRCSPVREDPSGDLPVGRWLPSSALRWWRLKKSSSPTGSPPPSGLQASGSLALIACPRPLSGDVGEGLVAAASALRPSLLLFGHLERRSLSLLPERAAVSHLESRRPAGPPMWGVVRTCGGRNQSSVCNGTLSAGVCSMWLSGPEHVGIFGCNTIFFSSFRALGLACRLTEPLNQV
jgi:hypothetical protein